ncbi:MAG: undecaprenyl-diphosphatase UppP [Ardenticatenaceae bacterium]|nr:undecaprenyl-diphosphatase UppP [Anaerolineales bacterium]MCB8922434.1 undecaprenyl-diphosphatase UppP [Ardenticatenaceae bacterium]MCB8991366.1 undecaprenyl-diphosphatase UppP [Ardenticatenaceae bacterium]MCB9005589.1 undecaprenyl-diphosphatase UppP [Ardenticatenaceae bacterium]
MSILEAIILGIVQGATEFLPVSSSGHLVLVPYLLKLTEPGLTMIAIVHEGTLLAVLAYFRRDIWEIVKGVLGGLRRRQPLATPESRLGWFIVLGSIPAAVVGLLFESYFEEVFGAPAVAAGFLLVTAVLLVIGERLMSGKKTLTHITWLDALIIGVFQMFALFPGISRSGSTITAGLIRGFDRATAARFSFLLGIPAILGAGLLAVFDIVQAGNLGSQWPTMLAGFVAAAVSGYACIHFLLTWLKQRSLYIFVVYVVLFSIVSFVAISF